MHTPPETGINSRSLYKPNPLARSCRLHRVDHRLRLSIHARSFRHVRVLRGARHFRHLPSVLRACCRSSKRHRSRRVLDSALIHGIRCRARCSRNVLALNLLKVRINGGCYSVELARRLPIVDGCRGRRRRGAILLHRVSGGCLRSDRHCGGRRSLYARGYGFQMYKVSFKHVE